ncbi:hypothetical protein [Paenibacillus hodogayensis]|uniref:hypothetical protein n=1 Tax=Paenibacillus hodogayensis TaxID=279208 RepID=UPI0031E52836
MIGSTPKRDDVEFYLKEAGFKRIETAILNLITDEEFETGLKNLLEYYSIHSGDPWLLQDKLSMCVGYKD